MKPVITESVYNTLHQLQHPLAPYLNENLSNAKVVDGKAVERTTISLNSIVEYESGPGMKPIRIQIVLPEHEDLGRRKVSVLAPVSRALLGYKQGDVLVARMPSGEKTIRILKVSNELPHAG